MRATSFDQEAALAQGINVGRVFGLVWLIAGILAGFSGFLLLEDSIHLRRQVLSLHFVPYQLW